MDARTARYLVFLGAAVVVADARPHPGDGPTLNVPKQRALGEALARRLGDHSDDDRARLVRDVLAITPTFEGGLAFLRRVEDAARRLGAGLDDAERWEVVGELARIAEADASVSFPELTVIRAVVANIGVPRPHQVDADSGVVLLPGA
ncbi:MAG: hypothetical protein H6732_03210 [Alphaproteobacteria bacterium]|nr:hypothetical protein [Alphaproteobacteria bacterium]